MLSALLAADPRGRVVLLADEQPAITDALMARLRKVLGPDVRRVGVVPRQDRPKVVRLVAAADVLLDTPPYGMGANTMADAVACGTPVVTVPGPAHRGRWAAAVLAQDGLPELVADSAAGYVATAVRVANDEPHRWQVSDALTAFGAGWFDVPTPAAELEEFWQERAAEARAG